MGKDIFQYWMKRIKTPVYPSEVGPVLHPPPSPPSPACLTKCILTVRFRFLLFQLAFAAPRSQDLDIRLNMTFYSVPVSF